MTGSVCRFTVVIPARYSSSRLPGKPLADIAGKPMIQHVFEKASQSDADRVIVATDDQRIVEVARGFGAEVCLTRVDHPSGTDRLQEVVSHYGLSQNDVVVNVQGDEPLIPPAVINQVASNLMKAPEADAATLAEPIRNAQDLFNPAVVKVVSDKTGYALYFSRSPMPWSRDSFATSTNALPDVDCFRRHIGIYAYRVGLLNQFVTWSQSPLEQLESLEQLRIQWHGHRIHVADALETPPHGVDTQEDLDAVRRIVEKQNA